MPWGNRSLLFRDPDGNLVNFLHAGHSGRYREVRLVVCQTEQRHRKKGA
jgi:copper oxidase (laccase) domain-containing protein